MHKIEFEIDQIEKQLKLMAQNIGVVAFARRVELHKSDVSSWLSGRRKWSNKKVLKVANILEV